MEEEDNDKDNPFDNNGTVPTNPRTTTTHSCEVWQQVHACIEIVRTFYLVRFDFYTFGNNAFVQLASL